MLKGVPMTKPSVAVAVVNKVDILKRLVNGEFLSTIGKSYGISQPAISKALLKECPEEFKEAQEASLIARLEAAEGDLDAIDRDTPMVMLGKSKEQISQAKWRLAVTIPDKYNLANNKQAINIQLNTIPTDQVFEKDVSDLIKKIRPDENTSEK